MLSYLSVVDWLIALTTILGLFYLYATWNYDFFKKQNINAAKPIPLFGNFGEAIFQKIPFAHLFQDIYNLYPGNKFTGFFEFRRPLLMLKDPDLIKQITIKDFDHFLDHRFVIDENVDPLFGKNLLFSSGQKWKEMRVTLSPAFTGSKMRGMFDMISSCADQAVNHIKKECERGEGIFELKDLSHRFANDVIANAAFGLKIDSFSDTENQFYILGKKIASPSGLQLMKFFGFTSFPDIMKYLKITIFDEFTSTFFRTIIKDTIALRERDNIHRPDMIHLLMQARKGQLKSEAEADESEGFATAKEHLATDDKNVKKRELTDDDITAQALIFFIAGFDSSATLMSFAAYELTVNEDVQWKLQADVDEVIQNNEKITYEVIQKMKYLDMVISETLRKWPPTPATDRCCLKPYVLNAGSSNVKLMPGDAVFIPIYALQRDPKFFPNPDKFDPERFSDINKHNIKQGSYLPFGAGPRNCIGSRFAIMEAKVLIFHLIANFDLKICGKTHIPMTLSKAGFALNAENGNWIEFKPRH